MEWESFLKGLDSGVLNRASTEDPKKVDELFDIETASQQNLKNNLKLKENPLNDFSRDEVFIDESKAVHKRSGKTLDDSSSKSTKKGNSSTSLVSANGLKSSNIVRLNVADSFIFIPDALTQENVQNCTTPKNETGICKSMQHCLIPTIVDSLSQFMGYVCLMDGRFIGLCCPNNPVSVVVVKDQKGEEAKEDSELNESEIFDFSYG